MGRKSADCFKVLRIGHILFFCGLAVMALALLLLQGDRTAIGITMGIVGMAACFGGLLYVSVLLRCPDCGKSLMLGGRIPGSLPSFCPNCGKKLEEISGD